MTRSLGHGLRKTDSISSPASPWLKLFDVWCGVKTTFEMEQPRVHPKLLEKCQHYTSTDIQFEASIELSAAS